MYEGFIVFINLGKSTSDSIEMEMNKLEITRGHLKNNVGVEMKGKYFIYVVNL